MSGTGMLSHPTENVTDEGKKKYLNIDLIILISTMVTVDLRFQD